MVDATRRPIVPVEHANEREHRRLLASRVNAALPKDGTEGLTPYTVATLPNATVAPGAIVYISDLGEFAWSDGTGWVTATPNWFAFDDRAALTAATIPSSVTRVYVRYYDTNNKDCFNPEASAPHISGHWMRRHTISGSGTIAQRDVAGWGNAQTGQYWRQTDVSPNLFWWWLSDALAGDPVWYEAGHTGYAWATSNGGTVYWQVDEIEPNALQMGALNGAMLATDDTVPLTDLCYFFAMGRDVFVPAGYYSISSTLTLKTLSRNTFRGEGSSGAGKFSTYISTGSNNINAFEIDEILGQQGFGGVLRDFAVFGGEMGIESLLTVEHGIRFTEWSNLSVFANHHAIYIPYCYSFSLVSVRAISVSTGSGFVMRGGVGTTFIECGGGASGTLTAAFRVTRPATFVGCNAVHTALGGSAAAYGYVLGGFASVSSTAAAGAASTITLNAGSTFVTDQIVGRDIVTTSGTGSGQTRRITAYNSGTKVATITPNWSVNPAAGTGYTIQDPISFMQGDTETSSHALLNCNSESFTKTGVRTVGDTYLSVINCTFAGDVGYECAIRLSAEVNDNSVVITNPRYNHSLASPSAASDLVIEGPCGLKGYVANSYFSVSTNQTEAFGPSTSTTVSHLPAASSVPAGTRGFVTDATSTTFHNTVAGGGANKVPVVSDGANWLIG